MYGLVKLIDARREIIDEELGLRASVKLGLYDDCALEEMMDRIEDLSVELISVESLLKRELYECLGMLCGLVKQPAPVEPPA